MTCGDSDALTRAVVEQWANRPAPSLEPSPTVHRKTPAVATHIRDAAVARYLADEAALHEAKRRRRKLRYQTRPDVLWLQKWAGRLLKAYDMVTSFLLAHAGGLVARSVRDRRCPYCETCTYRRRRLSPNLDNQPANGPLDWRDRCRGWSAAGRPCDCWDHPLWRPHAIMHLIWLRWFACPLGHWDEGNLLPDPPADQGER